MILKLPAALRTKRSLYVAIPLTVVALVFVAVHIARSSASFPTAEVQRREFVEYVELRGSVKALKSVAIGTPAAAGDLQILSIVANGTKVKRGGTLVEFDATTVRQNLAQDQSTLRSAEAEIQQAQSAARIKEEQDITNVMKARFAVENARMETQKQEILSKIEGEEANLKLADSEHALAEAEVTLQADRSSSTSNLVSMQKKRDAAAFEVERDHRKLSSLALLAPVDGVVIVEDNWQAAGPMQPATPFKAGDRAWPGSVIATIPDASALLISARVEEAQRGRLLLKQAVHVRVDAIPDRGYDGFLDNISSTASTDFNGGWPFPRNFTVDVALHDQDSRLTPGMGAVVRVAVDRVANGLVIPSSAVFRKEGRSVVYVRRGSKFEETPVEVARRSGDEVLIASGLAAGQTVALKDPSVPK
jgi:multidrug resistance efflux pump